MYSLKIFNEGLEYLGITNQELINSLFVSCAVEYDYLLQCEHRQRWRDRHKVERGLTKAEYKIILEETQDILNKLKVQINRTQDKFFLEMEQANYINKKEQLKKFMKPMTKGKLDIAKAKAYPVDQLLNFSHAGTTTCLWHEDKHPSLHHNKKNNTVHCFACGMSWDSIDIFSKLNNVTTAQAINALQ
jgi:hypothetical protein